LVSASVTGVLPARIAWTFAQSGRRGSRLTAVTRPVPPVTRFVNNSSVVCRCVRRYKGAMRRIAKARTFDGIGVEHERLA
jgi:hypothetical protein